MEAAPPNPLPPSALAEAKPLMKLGIPLMIGLAAATLIGVVDTVMIAPLGTVPLAAAGITTAFLIIVISALWGVLTIISVSISQADGAGDDLRVSRRLRTGLATALVAGVFGVIFMIACFPLLGLIGQPEEVLAILFPYWASMALWIIPFMLFFALKALFDAVGKEWSGVAISYVGVVTNIPANYALIHIAGLGILGAGLASILSQTIALMVAYGFWRFAPSMARYRQEAAVTVARVTEQLKESLPLCIGYAGEGGAYAMIGIMMGWLGATALAAHQVVNAVGGVAYMIPLGLAGAASIRVGQAVGQDRRARLRPILRAGLGLSVAWQTAAAIIFVTFGSYFAASLSSDPEVVALATLLFMVMAFLQVIDGIQGTALGALRGMSDNSVPTAITLVAYWPLALPAAYALAFVAGYGAVGLWAGYIVGLAIAATALPWRYWRLTAA